LGHVAHPLPKDWTIVCVDVQKDFLFETEWMVEDLPLILPKIVRLAQRFQHGTVFTRFINPMNRFFSKWSLCLEGSVGAELVDDLKPFANFVFDRTGYSCMKSTELVNFLMQNRVWSLYFAGVETDACVYASMLDAFELGFEVHVFEDCVASGKRPLHEPALTMMKKQFGDDAVIDSTDFLQSFG